VALRLTNVRSEPRPHNGKYEYDAIQETQIEEGEPVRVLEKQKNWFRIEAPEQPEFTHNNRWEGYPGWVEAKDLSKDLTRHHKIKKSTLPNAEARLEVLREARRHLGNPYLWGGRSLHDPENKTIVTGVDCSGLVNWSFRQIGWFIPRDAHEQSMRARQIEVKDLKPADLIFLADENNPAKVTHVAFFAGDEKILEAPQSGERVREVSFQERFQQPLQRLENGDKVGFKIISFGTFFSEGL